MTAERPERAKPAVGARIMAAGISVAAGVGLVGAMAVATASDPVPPTVRQVVLISSGEAASVRVEPLPDAAPRTAALAEPTESGGS